MYSLFVFAQNFGLLQSAARTLCAIPVHLRASICTRASFSLLMSADQDDGLLHKTINDVRLGQWPSQADCSGEKLD
jgi:hypothetical protein